jgi:hypothetical protein
MAFVRWKEDSAGSGSACVVANRRVHGRVRQKTLLYLGRGTSVEDAARNAELDLRKTLDELDRLLRAIRSRGVDVTVDEVTRHDRLLDRLRKLTARVEAFRTHGPLRNQRETVRPEPAAEPSDTPPVELEPDPLPPLVHRHTSPPINYLGDWERQALAVIARTRGVGPEGTHIG